MSTIVQMPVRVNPPPADTGETISPGCASLLMACVMSSVLIPACSSRVAIENDRLRLENQSLKSQVESLSAINAELAAKLNESSAARLAPMDADVLAALPRVASIEFDTLTGFFPGDRAKPATSVHVFVRPLDGRRRFVQAVGTFAVEAMIVPEEVGTDDGTMGTATEASPRVQLVRRLTPGEVREAYRSGLTGTHYEIELPLDAPLKERGATILVRAEFTDAVTGTVHKAEKLVKVPAAKAKPGPAGTVNAREASSR